MLENSTTKDRPAVQKAKVLYRSCMNESEWPMGLPGQDPVLGPPQPLAEQGTGHHSKLTWGDCVPRRLTIGSRLPASMG